METVKKIESLGSKNGKTTKNIIIADCGQLLDEELKEAKEDVESAEEDSESAEEDIESAEDRASGTGHQAAAQERFHGETGAGRGAQGGKDGH
jgi:hypothetical protein